MFTKNLGFSVHLRLSPASAAFFQSEAERLKLSLPDLIRAILTAYMAENGGVVIANSESDQ